MHLHLEGCVSTDMAPEASQDLGQMRVERAGDRPRRATQMLGEAPTSVLISQQFITLNIGVSVFSGMFLLIVSFKTIHFKNKYVPSCMPGTS